MAFGKKENRPQNHIDSLIGVGTKIDGNVNFTGGLRVDGHIVGSVIASSEEPSTLVVSEKAKIEGEIHVSHVVINGTVNGPVHSMEYLELQPNSKVSGDVYYKTLEMHLGSVVEGKLVHKEAQDGKSHIELKLASGK
jgi:cytoskeletal protein CcmA (bactofilin family)